MLCFINNNVPSFEECFSLVKLRSEVHPDTGE
jgi:hypothetical protein